MVLEVFWLCFQTNFLTQEDVEVEKLATRFSSLMSVEI